jgi:cyanate permease
LVLLGIGISYLLPLLFSVAGQRAAHSATAAAVVARISTLGYLGSFAGPAIIGALAGVVGLTLALVVPLLLLVFTAIAAGALAPDRGHDDHRKVSGIDATAS